MLFNSLYFEGLLSHMYFLDEKRVLIFKTYSNKMFYLKHVVIFLAIFKILVMLNACPF